MLKKYYKNVTKIFSFSLFYSNLFQFLLKTFKKIMFTISNFSHFSNFSNFTNFSYLFLSFPTFSFFAQKHDITITIKFVFWWLMYGIYKWFLKFVLMNNFLIKFYINLQTRNLPHQFTNCKGSGVFYG